MHTFRRRIVERGLLAQGRDGDRDRQLTKKRPPGGGKAQPHHPRSVPLPRTQTTLKIILKKT